MPPTAEFQGTPRFELIRELGQGSMGVVHEAGEVAAQGGLVLAARCHQRESVPFQTIDGVVDAPRARAHVGSTARSVAAHRAWVVVRVALPKLRIARKVPPGSPSCDHRDRAS